MSTASPVSGLTMLLGILLIKVLMLVLVVASIRFRLSVVFLEELVPIMVTTTTPFIVL